MMSLHWGNSNFHRQAGRFPGMHVAIQMENPSETAVREKATGVFAWAAPPALATSAKHDDQAILSNLFDVLMQLGQGNVHRSRNVAALVRPPIADENAKNIDSRIEQGLQGQRI